MAGFQNKSEPFYFEAVIFLFWEHGGQGCPHCFNVQACRVEYVLCDDTIGETLGIPACDGARAKADLGGGGPKQ